MADVTDKPGLRSDLLGRRRQRPAAELATLRAALAEVVLDERQRREWTCVAGYVPLPGEPGSVEMLRALSDRGVRVLVPVLLDDRDLAWTVWTDDLDWRGRSGPAGGPDPERASLADAQAVLVPALAVGRDGTRLGRGGGSYDRALGRAADGAVLAAVIFTDEVRDQVPRDPWDVPMTAAVTPSGWITLPR